LVNSYFECSGNKSVLVHEVFYSADVLVCSRLPSSWCTEACGDWLELSRCETTPDNWHVWNQNRLNGSVVQTSYTSC